MKAPLSRARLEPPNLELHRFAEENSGGVIPLDLLRDAHREVRSSGYVDPYMVPVEVFRQLCLEALSEIPIIPVCHDNIDGISLLSDPMLDEARRKILEFSGAFVQIDRKEFSLITDKQAQTTMKAIDDSVAREFHPSVIFVNLKKQQSVGRVSGVLYISIYIDIDIYYLHPLQNLDTT